MQSSQEILPPLEILPVEMWREIVYFIRPKECFPKMMLIHSSINNTIFEDEMVYRIMFENYWSRLNPYVLKEDVFHLVDDSYRKSFMLSNSRVYRSMVELGAKMSTQDENSRKTYFFLRMISRTRDMFDEVLHQKSYFDRDSISIMNHLYGYNEKEQTEIVIVFPSQMYMFRSEKYIIPPTTYLDCSTSEDIISITVTPKIQEKEKEEEEEEIQEQKIKRTRLTFQKLEIKGVSRSYGRKVVFQYSTCSDQFKRKKGGYEMSENIQIKKIEKFVFAYNRSEVLKKVPEHISSQFDEMETTENIYIPIVNCRNERIEYLCDNLASYFTDHSENLFGDCMKITFLKETKIHKSQPSGKKYVEYKTQYIKKTKYFYVPYSMLKM